MLDSHCHLDRYQSPQTVAASAGKAGVFVVAVTNLPSHFELGLPHVKEFSRVRLALGLHPLAAEQHGAEREGFKRLFPSTSFVGEVGLDFSREGKGTKDIQIESFHFVAELLSRRPKFVTAHSRGAEKEMLDILTRFNITPIVFHWYSGPLALIDGILAAGHFFSINPAMTLSESGKKVIARIPRDRLLTETDGPHVKVGNTPAAPEAVQFVEEYLAETWREEATLVSKQVWENFRSLLAAVGLLNKL